MLNYLDYLNMPQKTGLIIVGLLLVMNLIGELLSFKGKVVPEFMCWIQFFKRKRKERETVISACELVSEVKKALDNMNAHYNADNIQMRDNWIKSVDQRLEENARIIQELDKSLARNNEDTLALLIDHKRNVIIRFAARVAEDTAPVTREEFKRVFKLHKEYEDIINANNMTNGEVDVAYRIICESYEKHMRNHTFLEDIRGYNT